MRWTSARVAIWLQQFNYTARRLLDELLPAQKIAMSG